jgi:hypothetical protein
MPLNLRPHDSRGITLPQIHRNGTSKESLQHDYDAAANSLRAFIRDWKAIEFNARDYYTQGPAEWTIAVNEREIVNASIKQVHDYLETIREHLYA